MHIRIKTQEEFRDDHVVIEIVADRAEIDGATSTAQALRERGDRLADRVAKLEAENARSADDLATSKANVAELRQALKDRDNRLDEATTESQRLIAQFGRVSGLVHTPLIVSALRTPWPSWGESHAVELTSAVRDIRRIIGSPSPDTSQA
jgi:hypothetical protein